MVLMKSAQVPGTYIYIRTSNTERVKAILKLTSNLIGLIQWETYKINNSP